MFLFKQRADNMSYDFIDEYNKIEAEIAGEFESVYQESNLHLLNTLEYFKNYLLRIKGIMSNDYPKSTIHLFIGSNYDLLYQSYTLLKHGYFRPSLILLRPVYESVVLCMYFWEFQDKEGEYRAAINKYAWIHNEGATSRMIKKIENDGKIFNKAQNPDMFTNLIGNTLREINKFVHFNHEQLLNSATSVDIDGYCLGPKRIDEYLVNSLIISILDAGIPFVYGK